MEAIRGSLLQFFLRWQSFHLWPLTTSQSTPLDSVKQKHKNTNTVAAMTNLQVFICNLSP